jgi:hypothetical protein
LSDNGCRAKRFRILQILFVPELAVASLAVAPRPASAHPAAGSWSDNHQLCTSTSSCVTSGRLVRLWQNILLARNLDISCMYVDGLFGPNTRRVTMSWQASEGIAADGWVGPQTWSRAAGHLARTPERDEIGQVHYIYVDREGGRSIRLFREANTSIWWYQDRCGDIWRRADH